MQEGGGAQRATKTQAQTVEVEVESAPKESAMKKAKKQSKTGGDSSQRVVREHRVTEDDLKR